MDQSILTVTSAPMPKTAASRMNIGPCSSALKHLVLIGAGWIWFPPECKPAGALAGLLDSCGYRLSRLACAACRCRLRFLTDWRRRFMMTSAALIDAPDVR